jgi:hypothetical protein
MDERLRDPETRALNTSAVFRELRSAIINTKTPEELGRAAASFLRLNEQRSEELRRHRTDPERFSLPAEIPLTARERNLLFTGRAPDHHTREMRELRLGYGLSRAERRESALALHDGRIEPSDALKTMLQELETRKTAKAVAHFQAGILNEKMTHTGQVNLHLLSQRIPPHERSYLFEISEEHLQDRARIAQATRNDFIAEKVAVAERTITERAANQESAEERRKFQQKVIESLAPSDARQLAALEQYTAQTREEVYRGFEILDVQRRDLDLKRTQSNQQMREVDPPHLFSFEWGETPVRSGHLQFEPALIPSRNGFHVARSEIAETGRRSEQPKSLSRMPSPNSNQEWHFHSLRDVLPADVNPHRVESRAREDWQHDR